jgi:uncharacterized SAM-binding protein YcdF (DUF218 family)
MLKIVLLVMVAWTVVAAAAARFLIVRAPLEKADAIVVLSGSSAYRERTQKAAQLFREGRAPRVLLTDDHTRGGWDNAQQRNPFFVERAKDELIKGGVPQDRIEIVPGVAVSTRDEAFIIRDYAARERLKSVLVVTSAYHSRRALRSLRKAMVDTGTTVGIEPTDNGAQVFWWLQLEGWRNVGGEYAKLIYYWFKYD